ncbi:DUF3800 domain-containing protein [Chryseobacterium sp. C-39]|uniref:DUF3800 domain-containing protein n=2 Tax=Flavobacteriales TaxID=200644 RepID=A0A9Q3UYB6_9FLAO|nr:MULTISPECIES: DUF3800 domain-containing protein [Flavobacteriales]MBD3906109.1 DUF3800 domain-containing protein [Chryseobacterium muglaense]MCC9036213.1 DUF3800 domain-containing protein [Chryseobacterium muglaense]MCC9070603.1 DUF3800 domain-containing protein [Flavobacterium sp. F-65]
MIDFEIAEIEDANQFARLLNPRVDFATPYIFYYDETNNIKTFYVRENDFNYTFTANFVLGGLLHQGEVPDVQPLIDSFKLQKTAKEVKFKHIAFGDFLDCLKSQKLNLFLHFLKDSDLYVHYSSLNILYWSIVDIVDSAIMNSDVAMRLGPGFDNRLKNDLYKLCRLEIDAVIQLFYTFEYPNVKPEKIGDFIEALSNLFEAYLQLPEFHFGLESLRQILKESKKKGELAFVMDEKDYILLADLTHFYLRPIYTFKNSTHIFDNEDSIREALNGYRMLDKGVEFKNYSFVDSQDSQLTQLSDVFVGFMGKYTNYRNTHNMEEIKADIDSFSALQLENMKLFIDIINKSDQKNPAFLHATDSYEEVMKFGELCEIIAGK